MIPGVERIVIVGAGILGTMHAWMAVRAGAEVVHLDADVGPRRASVRNFGLVWVSGRAAGAELALAQRARDHWQVIGAAVDGTGFRANGSLTVALDGDELAVLAGAVELPDADERGFTLVGPDETAQRNPAVRGRVAGALWCARDAVVEPGRVLGALRDALGRTGRYRFEPGRRAVEAGHGVVRDAAGRTEGADLVIVCPGADHEGLAAEVLAAAPLRRCRLQMMETAPLGEPCPTSLADIDSLRYYPAFASLRLDALAPQPAVAAEHRMQLLAVQRLDGGITIGDTHAYDEPFPVGVTEGPYEHLRARAEAILGRALPTVVRRWSGVYSQATDDSACVRLRLDDTTWVVTGPGGRGMTLSPALAEDTLVAAGLGDRLAGVVPA
jgi:FAD dependent oxidoreductase TIGR03364